MLRSSKLLRVSSLCSSEPSSNRLALRCLKSRKLEATASEMTGTKTAVLSATRMLYLTTLHPGKEPHKKLRFPLKHSYRLFSNVERLDVKEDKQTPRNVESAQHQLNGKGQEEDPADKASWRLCHRRHLTLLSQSCMRRPHIFLIVTTRPALCRGLILVR